MERLQEEMAARLANAMRKARERTEEEKQKLATTAAGKMVSFLKLRQGVRLSQKGAGILKDGAEDAETKKGVTLGGEEVVTAVRKVFCRLWWQITAKNCLARPCLLAVVISDQGRAMWGILNICPQIEKLFVIRVVGDSGKRKG